MVSEKHPLGWTISTILAVVGSVFVLLTPVNAVAHAVAYWLYMGSAIAGAYYAFRYVFGSGVRFSTDQTAVLVKLTVSFLASAVLIRFRLEPAYLFPMVMTVIQAIPTLREWYRRMK